MLHTSVRKYWKHAMILQMYFILLIIIILYADNLQTPKLLHSPSGQTGRIRARDFLGWKKCKSMYILYVLYITTMLCERRYKVILHTVIFHTQFTIGLIRMNEGMPLALPYCMSKLRGYIRNLPEVLPYTATTSY